MSLTPTGSSWTSPTRRTTSTLRATPTRPLPSSGSRISSRQWSRRCRGKGPPSPGGFPVGGGPNIPPGRDREKSGRAGEAYPNMAGPTGGGEATCKFPDEAIGDLSAEVEKAIAPVEREVELLPDHPPGGAAAHREVL